MARGKGNGPGRPPGSGKTHAPVEGASKLVVTNRYDAGGTGRRMKGWNAPSTGPNRVVQGTEKVRDRSRDARRNDWSGESATQKWTTTLIGIGIVPRFKRITDKARKQFITDLYNDFVQQSDADCVLNLYGQQSLGSTSWLESGEVFIRRRDRRLDAGYAVPMQVQLLESDFCPMFDAETWPGMPTGNIIRSGIELDRIGKRVAYWMFRNHPGDGYRQGNSGTLATASNLIRIPAGQIRHMFMPSRPGALRGVSPLAPILARLRSIGDYDDAVLERQKLANLFMAFIKYSLPTAADPDVDPLTGLALQGAPDSPLAGLAPGMVQELEPGQDVSFANPPEAGTTYSDYMRTQHLGTAAGTGMPYELLSGDILNISDRTLRVIINEFRRFAEQRQWQVVIPMMCQPIIEWFAEAALLAGKVSVEEVEMIRRCEHAPHGWAHIHPVQDPQGKKIEVDAGFRSRSSVIGAMGDDPDTVDDERKADKDREDALGLTPPPPPAAGGQPTGNKAQTQQQP